MEKSFAVCPEALNRSVSYSPTSSSWTLYDPTKLAEKLNVPISAANDALEQTGFNKAVRIREELIKWKERMRKEQLELAKEKQIHQKELKKIGGREKELKEMLVNVRNILRIPRENRS